MDLIRDVLDKLVVDRNGRELGRADAVVLEIRPQAPPRVTAIELGPAVLASRVRPLFGRWMAGLEHALGIDEGRPLRIAFAKILDVTPHVKVDVAVGETPSGIVESRLRRWFARIPGGA